jgi:Sulfotransferase domain
VTASAAARPTIKRRAQKVSLTAGRLTNRGRMLPGFLIVGAQRCGTTSLYRALSQHPAILKAVLHKGVHYFDTDYGRGMSWYRAHFPLKAHARRAQQRTGTTPLTFESSPYYMFHPLAGERIARDLPGVKLLVLVRDPVERAYSAHTHESARGFETESFEHALELEEARLDGEAERIISHQPAYVSLSHQHHAYRERGKYADQLSRLAALFGRDRIHVIDSGDWFSQPGPVYGAVLEFLGLPRRGEPIFERHNARPRAPMPQTLRSALQEYFAPYDEQLAAWLGHPPSWRR